MEINSEPGTKLTDQNKYLIEKRLKHDGKTTSIYIYFLKNHNS